MMQLRSLVLFTLFLLGAVGRRNRVGDAHYQAQQQVDTLAKAREVSDDTRELFHPWGTGSRIFRSRGPQAGASHQTLAPHSQHSSARSRVPVRMDIGFGSMTYAPPASGWSINEITPDGSLMQRIEGHTRKTWKFTDHSKDRVQVALTSEGRPVHADVHLWLGPNYTPFAIKAYSEDGKLRPVQALVGTKNKEVTVEVKNVGDSEFPIKAASNYAQGAMAELPIEMPAATEGERVDGQALRSYPLNSGARQLEVILNTEGRQLKARVELLNAPNNPKQTFEVYASDGQLTSLCVCFDTPDEGNTVRILNLSPVEFPFDIHLNEK